MMNSTGLSLGTSVRSSSSIAQPRGRKRVVERMSRRPSRKRPSLSRIYVGTADSLILSSRSYDTSHRASGTPLSVLPGHNTTALPLFGILTCDNNSMKLGRKMQAGLTQLLDRSDGSRAD